MVFDKRFADIIAGKAPKIMLEITHQERPIPLLVLLPDGREAARMNPDGDVVIASDLTLEEAKWVIERLIADDVRRSGRWGRRGDE